MPMERRAVSPKKNDGSRRNSDPRHKFLRNQAGIKKSRSQLSLVPGRWRGHGLMSWRETLRNFNLRDPDRIAWLQSKSRKLYASWRFTALTTILTVYALFGDDFRLALTHKRTDELFNAFTLLSIVVFGIEIVANCLGQEEYFMGFFFYLDFGSTITLAFDLTWFSNAVFCSGSASEGEKASRAGRAGARASRTVRIIRLMRLAKLYKAYWIAMERRKEQEERSRLAPGEEMLEEELLAKSEFEVHQTEENQDDDDLSGGEEDGKGSKGKDSLPKAETRVGKKLSDMTTRRVIILVLVMLVCLPQFNQGSGGNIFVTGADFRDSSNFGADLVYDRWRSWCNLDGRNTSQSVCNPAKLLEKTPGDSSTWDSFIWDNFQKRFELEAALLRFVHLHHYGQFFWRLYWVGLYSKVNNNMENLGKIGALNNEFFLGPELTVPALSVEEVWNFRYANPSWTSEVKKVSSEAKTRLTGPWTEVCDSFVGVVVQPEARADTPKGCSISKELRCSEVEYITALSNTEEDMDKLSFVFAFDQRGETKLEAGLSMLQTVFICFCVGLGAMSFSKDANELLLHPIERMIEKMETIKDNPLEAMRLGDLEYRREEVEQARFKEKLNQMSRPWQVYYKYRQKKVKEPMETVMLEKTIIKLGGLLALGFGEAGAEIIGQNMKGGATAGINAMVPGSRVEAIIGFCNIRNFGEATEVLKEKVMLFVNQVGEIVHGCVDDCHGAPNKNIGEAFLLVWRLSGKTQEKQTKLADMALMSYIKIIAEINKSKTLAVYRNHPGLLQRLPKFRVEMGFGLHCGWAIEGAIGSEFKIDASYLSPNVNVAARLEAATSQFKVWVLISHFMLNMCSQQVALNCRLIDHVTVKGSRLPVRLYTIDLDCEKIEVEYRKVPMVIRNRFKIRQLRELRKAEKWQEDFRVWEYLNTNVDIQLMRKRYSEEFFQRFAMAYRNYEAGEWMAARDMFFTCHYQPRSDVGRSLIRSEADWPVDGPTVTLLKFMAQTNFLPPPDWPGHRVLTDK
ncbi:unnamed protein product [Polarella glacialis]|uniref:Guanylate cyclase domain-containing protein n=2 Tax=Polarella glacialis TaxID=89957 RepID=A0A813HLH3_POLGL|nr:unnamed protein product [Polarella glacialis]